MFRKKFKVRVRRSSVYDRECFYVEYTYYRFFSDWKVIKHWLINAETTVSFVKEREKAEEFAKLFNNIEKVRRYNKHLKGLIHKHDKYYTTKTIISK